MNAEHSPLPWRVKPCFSEDGDKWPIILPAPPSMPVSLAQVYGEENAIYIVKACNAYPLVVEMLQRALEWIDAVPQETPLPAMPGFNRDEVDSLLHNLTKSPQ